MGKSKVQISSIKFKSGSIRKVLMSADMQNAVTGVANRIAAAAGPGFEVNAAVGKNRARASVRSETTAAKRAEATERALTRAIDAGKG